MYFDLHLHPSTKAFLTGPAFGDKKSDCWETFDNLLVDIVDSQSSLSQLCDGKVRLAVACLYAMEPPFSSNIIVGHLLHKFTYVHKDAFRFSGTDDAYKRLEKELALLQSVPQKENRSIKFINAISETEPDKLNLILAVEGAHSFGAEQTLLTNFIQMKKSGPRLLYLTLTHLTRAYCASHAYNIKLIKNNDEFKPLGGGLYDLGREVIDAAYDEKIGGHRVFIDIKHMSLQARIDFYNYKAEKYSKCDIPIIASHVACTGISINDIGKYIKKDYINHFSSPSSIRVEAKQYAVVEYKQVPGYDGMQFNPVSINLYDEEIIKVVESGGLIGLILETKMLGMSPKKHEEIFELEEYIKLKGGRDKVKGRDNEEFLDDTTPDFDTQRIVQTAEERINFKKHLRHLAQQVVHIVKTVNHPKAWNHICIGSDFDGLISSPDCCINASEYIILKTKLAAEIEDLFKKTNLAAHSQNIQGEVDKILYLNAELFLKKYF